MARLQQADSFPSRFKSDSLSAMAPSAFESSQRRARKLRDHFERARREVGALSKGSHEQGSSLQDSLQDEELWQGGAREWQEEELADESQLRRRALQPLLRIQDDRRREPQSL